MLHQISNFEVKITEISEFEFVTVIAIVDLVVQQEGTNFPSIAPLITEIS